MSDDAQHDAATPSGGTGTGDFLAQMARDLGETVRREVEQLRTEVGERAAGGAKGARLLAGAAVAGTITLASIGSLPLIALRRVMPGWAIALSIAGGAGAATAILARRGLSELAAAAPGTEGIKDAAREAVRSHLS